MRATEEVPTVPFRTPKSREALGQVGRDYADAVIAFMNARGYQLDARAEDTGEGEDLVFVPKLSTKSPIVAEAKYRDEDTGFSPNNYKTGFGERFQQWTDGTYQDYNFHLFVAELSNPSLWRDLFHKHDSSSIKSFYEKVCAAADGDLADFLSKHDYTGFERFIESTVIWGNYSRSDLIRIAERTSETGEYDYDPYLETYDTVHESGTHRLNLLEAASLPSTLHQYTALDGTNTRSFYRHRENRLNPTYYHEGTIYSLLAPSELPKATTDFCTDTATETTPFNEWATTDPSTHQVNTAKSLLRGLLTRIGTENDAIVTRERNDTRLLMPRDDSDQTINNQWVAKELDKTPEVRHRAIVVQVTWLAGSYFYTLSPKQEFTRDGRTPVSGKRKSELAAKFSLGDHPQNKRQWKSILIWESVLSPNQSLLRFNWPQALQELELARVSDLTLDGIRPPASGDERAGLITRVIGGQHALDTTSRGDSETDD